MYYYHCHHCCYWVTVLISSLYGSVQRNVAILSEFNFLHRLPRQIESKYG
jgi:hypothetical protein